MLKKVLCIALVMVFALGVTAFAGGEPSDWAKAEIKDEYVKMFNNVNIDIDYQRPITRAEFAMLAFDVYGDINGGYPKIEVKKVFQDIGAEKVDTIIPMVAALGIVNGVSETHFDPKAPVTREQVCTMLARISSKLDTAYTEKLNLANASNAIGGYVDNTNVSTWAKESVTFCVYTGIMKGVSENELAPLSNITVEQAMILCGRLTAGK